MTIFDSTSLSVFQELVRAAKSHLAQPNQATKETLAMLTRNAQKTIDQLKDLEGRGGGTPSPSLSHEVTPEVMSRGRAAGI